MKNSQKAQKALDKRFQAMKPYHNFDKPHKGWIRAVRDALGMTTTQLAKRLKVSQPTLFEYEKREIEGTITLNTLEKAAQAMGCRLLYAIVPENTLEALVQRQAEKVARAMFNKVEHTMRLEEQEISNDETNYQFQKFLDKVKEQSSRLWEEDSE